VPPTSNEHFVHYNHKKRANSPRLLPLAHRKHRERATYRHRLIDALDCAV